MGGDATFAGTTYQARVLALANVHVLTQSPLGWIPAMNDTPVAVSGETRGPGDDIRLEFSGGQAPFEAQAKHGLNAAGDLDEVVAHLKNDPALDAGAGSGVAAGGAQAGNGTTSAEQMRVVLVVNRASTKALYTEFADDLARLRSGRTDGARAALRRLVDGDPKLGPVLERLFVVPVDVDHAHDPESKHALTLLRSVLEDPERAGDAWNTLVVDANDVCARRLRRDRPALVTLLGAQGIRVRPPVPDERWIRQLDFTRDLLLRKHAAAAMSRLRQIAAELRALGDGSDAAVSNQVHYRLAQQQGAAYLMLGRSSEALAKSERALDYDRSGVHALATAAAAAADTGDLPLATAYALRAVDAHPTDALAWSTRVQIAQLTDEHISDIPSEVLASPAFRCVEARMSMGRGDWPEALRITGDLLAEGTRSNDTLYCRIGALINLSSTSNEAEYRSDMLPSLREAVRLATELLEQIDDDAHPLTVQTYVARACAHRLLGREHEADADLAHARRIDGADAETLWHTAAALIERDRKAEALSVLRHPAADSDARLLSMRARLLVAVGLLAEARDTLGQVERLSPSAADASEVYAQVAETALLLNDASGARKALARLAPDQRGAVVVLRASAQLAVTDGQIDSAVGLFRAAAAASPKNRILLLAEAAHELQRAGRPDEAVALFDEAIGITPLVDLPVDEVARPFAIALMRSHQLVRAQDLVDALLAPAPTRQPPPSWVLGLATEIAVTRDDPELAIQHLQQLVERDGSDVSVRIELARWLLEVGRLDEARGQIEWLSEQRTLAADARMAVAQLLLAAGESAAAVDVAFRAFRDGATQPALHRAFVALVLTSRSSPDVRTSVDPDTHVILRKGDGEVSRFTVLAEGPIDPLRGELSVQDAEAAGLMGRGIGDQVVRNRGSWNEERSTIEVLMPAVQYAVTDAAERFAERFPGEPFFVTGIAVRGDGPDALDPLIAAIQSSSYERRAHIKRIFDLLAATVLPLGFVAHATGTNVVGVMQFLSHEVRVGAAADWEDVAGTPLLAHDDSAASADAKRVTPMPNILEPALDSPSHDGSDGEPREPLADGQQAGPPNGTSTPPRLFVEWGDKNGQAESQAAASESRELVLTRSALETIEQLGLLQNLGLLYSLVAPRSLRELLRGEAREAEQHVRDGLKNVAGGARGISFVDIAPGGIVLERAQRRAVERLAWFDMHVQVEARPLESIPQTGSRDAELRTQIGADSFDALRLAQHRRSTLYADDLGLRRFVTPDSGCRSCSTVGVLHAMEVRGALAAEERDTHMLRLVEWRYALVPVYDALLARAVNLATTVPMSTVRAAFDLLGESELNLDQAAHIVSLVLRHVATAPVAVLGIAAVAELSLPSLSARWGARAAAAAIVRAAQYALRFLPLELNTVEGCCTRFVRDHAMDAMLVRNTAERRRV